MINYVHPTRPRPKINYVHPARESYAGYANSFKTGPVPTFDDLPGGINYRHPKRG